MSPSSNAERPAMIKDGAAHRGPRSSLRCGLMGTSRSNHNSKPVSQNDGLSVYEDQAVDRFGDGRAYRGRYSLWALRGSNPRNSPCKGGTKVLVRDLSP